MKKRILKRCVVFAQRGRKQKNKLKMSKTASKNTVQVEDDKKAEHLVRRARCQDKTKPCVWQTHT